MCKSMEESADHLFLHCKWAIDVWRQCMGWWGVYWCCSKTLVDWALGWFGLCSKPSQGRAWNTLFFATVWTIWECRNQVILRNSDQGVGQAVDMIKIRVVWWFKHFAEGCKEPITVMLQNIADRCSVLKPSKVVSEGDWTPPPFGALKFNVDGSARGNLGDAVSVVS